jgi:hypothetical protein
MIDPDASPPISDSAPNLSAAVNYHPFFRLGAAPGPGLGPTADGIT